MFVFLFAGICEALAGIGQAPAWPYLSLMYPKLPAAGKNHQQGKMLWLQ